MVALLGSLYVSISLHGNHMADVAYKGAHDQDDQKEKDNSDFTIWEYEGLSHM